MGPGVQLARIRVRVRTWTPMGTPVPFPRVDIRLLDVDVVRLAVILLDSHVIGIQVLLKFIVTCTWDDIHNLPLPQLQVL